jgi:hypothetical protein
MPQHPSSQEHRGSYAVSRCPYALTTSFCGFEVQGSNTSHQPQGARQGPQVGFYNFGLSGDTRSSAPKSARDDKVLSMARVGVDSFDPLIHALTALSPVSNLEIVVRGRQFSTPIQAYIFIRVDDCLQGSLQSLYAAITKYTNGMCIRAAIVEVSTIGRVLTKRQILGSPYNSFQMLEVTKEVLWSESGC